MVNAADVLQLVIFVVDVTLAAGLYSDPAKRSSKVETTLKNEAFNE